MPLRYRIHGALAATVVLLAGLMPNHSSAAQASNQLTYKLILKHGIVGTKKMGTQIVKVTTIDGKNGSYDVDTRMTIDFKPFILMSRVKVSQVTREVWRGGEIVIFESKTNDRGKEFHVLANQKDDGLVVVAGDETRSVSRQAAPTSYWYEPLFKARSQFFDTKSGRLQDLKLGFVGMAQINYRGKQFPVRHYRVVEDEKAREFWYFETGIMYMRRWEEDEGGTVTYVLQ